MVTALHKRRDYRHWELFVMRSHADVMVCLQSFDVMHPAAFRHSRLEDDGAVCHGRLLGDRMVLTFFTDGGRRNEIYIMGVVVGKWLKTVQPLRAMRHVFKDLHRLLAQENRLNARLCDRKLALAMSLHPRLGRQSTLSLFLDADLIEHISSTI
jgi:hypothetical protein